MTPADVLAECAVAGVEVYLRPDGSPAYRGNPNPALVAALKEHRAGIVAQLGGTVEPETCPDCRAAVFAAEDSEAFCGRRCPMRRRLR